ncbi:hypothetical protein AWB81_07504 [Caballeronia arationis]|jgi:hypothetical protein|uniref:Uncharacterized protein n=2 Tax=Caballeronia arationis TaxID=1777142 RepID=A0A7Z7I649_9BURK|nr:hypothetical protein [Caballeronia arationis]SAL06244.1 hypothetical protein AWB81_07504 [Caballeronia arationis]SOE66918.1 hypothetical protein SAMN05446927_3177 [Caballeronia arationis]
MMGILGWLKIDDEASNERREPEQVEELVDRVKALIPRLRMARRSHERLAPAVAESLRYATDLVGSLRAPHEASSCAWATDPYMLAFFARREDLAERISRSEELRAYFQQNPDSEHAYAVLGMALKERHVLGVALEGEIVHRDVAQTTVCFGDHRVRICSRSESDLRREVVRRVIDQLAFTGLGKLAKDHRDVLEQGRALLKRRLRLLEREGTGMRSVCGGGSPVTREELIQLQAQIENNSRHLSELSVPTDALERQLDGVCRVLMEPEKHVRLIKKNIRLNPMNVVQTGESVQAADDLEFHIAFRRGRLKSVR